MNSEELEQSLRTEFESYLKTVLADLRQETAEFQTKVQAEVDNHKAQLDNAFREYANRFDSQHTFDEAFRGSVAEHLRLARDEGARITADAMAAAEELKEPVAAAPVPTKYDSIRDAVKDIGGKDSQSAILKSLVQHAADFAPRGAFFIIKNDHFVGWKVFGAGTDQAEDAIREIHFSIANDSILGAAVRSSKTVGGSAGDHSDDRSFLEPLNFGQPGAMYAIPLMARGRGVAVLYTDHGNGSEALNIEALETLVSVSGLTVELLAATHTAKTDNRQAASADFENAQHDTDSGFSAPPARVVEPVVEYTPPPAPAAPPVVAPETFSFSDSVSSQGGFPLEPPAPAYDAPKFEPTAFDASQFEVSQFDEPKAPEPRTYEAEVVSEERSTYEPVFSRNETPVAEPSFTEYKPATESPFETAGNSFETLKPAAEPAYEANDAAGAMVFDTPSQPEPASPAYSPFEQPVETYEPAAAVSGFSKAVEPIIEPPVVLPPKARLSDRPVDLPIEVPEEERRIHNDARRFARLLVSEIKLYNEKKVLEGRQAHDLYDRLREAIDRSREMYDKRVQPPVAAKFDYFHYEIVNSLAEGNAERLGSGYPGASV